MKKFLLIIFILFLAFMAVYTSVSAQTTPPANIPLAQLVGKVWYTIDDSSKQAYFFQTIETQGCPANIYIHDTMYIWHDGTYVNVPDPNPPVPQFIHDTLYLPKFVHDTVKICPTPPPPPPAVTSIFTTQTLPTTTTTDGQGITLGVRFTSSANGYIKGIRFYKVSTNTGTHTAFLYSSTGTVLATAVFTETTSGWQNAIFTTSVPITAGTIYVAAYFSPNGQYSNTLNAFAVAITNSPLTAPASTTTNLNGVYSYGTVATFPINSYQKSNYWVDLMESPTP